jgi:hypothetical protein
MIASSMVRWLAVIMLVGACAPSLPSTEPGDGCPPQAKTMHRLNRTEYDHTVRDLLGVATTLAFTFPPDDVGGAFDNNADVLSMSPLLVERLHVAAETASWAAFTDEQNGVGYQRIGRCQPREDSEACAQRLLVVLLTRAFRRPPTTAEQQGFLRVMTDAMGNGDSFAVALRTVAEAVLLSPSFLFRIEYDDVTDDRRRTLNDWELASRLSYFLWSSMPDDALFTRAASGSLGYPGVLRSEVIRMLADPRAQTGIVEGIAGQWLQARGFDRTQVDPPLSVALRDGMAAETRMTVAELLAGDRPADDIIDLDHTWVNQALANHYGVGFPSAGGFAQVSLPDRVGLLGHAAYLTTNSYPERTNPVRRGYFVVDRLLCVPPGNPPDDVPPLVEEVDGTLRERLSAHRASPDCAGCHALMDPVGFGLERFGTRGETRSQDEDGAAIDDDDVFFGVPFTDPIELATAVKQQSLFRPCMVRHLTEYAMGRGIDDQQDACGLSAAQSRAEASGFSFADIITAIVLGDSFRGRATVEVP